MELSHLLLDAIWRPKFVFQHEQVRLRYRQSQSDQASLPWNLSQLNPKNRIDSLDTASSQWRVDGATICGTQFFVVPLTLLPALVPLRIDLFMPDQQDHPQELHRALDSSYSVVLRHPSSISNLGISRHICRALDSYCKRNPDFLTRYHTLPFGSKLAFEKVFADVNKMNLTIYPAYDLERASFSVQSLQKLWNSRFTNITWPETVDIGRLQLLQQLHDSVSLVSITDNKSPLPDKFIFKSNTNGLSHLYHELRILLTIPRHPNIMPRPIHLVTKKNCFGGKRGVVGFTLPYYPKGSIRDLLPQRMQSGALPLADQLKWSQQVTMAMLHIRDLGKTFYSDLRPDNVLLSGPLEGPIGNEDIVVCDFEQRGNWHEWCAPEILVAQYIENLRSNLPNSAVSSRWLQLVKSFHDHLACKAPFGSSDEDTVEESVRAKNSAWFSLSSSAQEKAQVYSLGLFFYCVFEGTSNVRINIANAYPFEPEVEFPHFKRTPARVREIIRRCTIDAPEWSESDGSCSRETWVRPKRVVRIDDRLFPEGENLLQRERDEHMDAVMHTGLEWWMSELARAEEFFKSPHWKNKSFGEHRLSLEQILAMLDEVVKGTE